MVSTANARVADGFERVLVLAPMPQALGSIPGAVEDVQRLKEHGRAVLISPDAASIAAIGPNPYDANRRAAVALAGREQGELAADAAREVWRD